METNQLVENMARAIESAKPAQEYCFLWNDWWASCMTKAEWSGWMQAFGAALALVVAIALPYIQARNAHVKNYRMAKNCLMHQLGALLAIQAFAQLRGDGLSALGNGRETVDTVVKAFDEVRPSELPKGSLPSWLGARSSASQLKALIAKLDELPRHQGQLAGVIDGYRKTAEHCLKSFSLFDPSIFAAITRRLKVAPPSQSSK